MTRGSVPSVPKCGSPYARTHIKTYVPCDTRDTETSSPLLRGGFQ